MPDAVPGLPVQPSQEEIIHPAERLVAEPSLTQYAEKPRGIQRGLENVASMGVPVPKILLKLLEIMKEKGDAPEEKPAEEQADE